LELLEFGIFPSVASASHINNSPVGQGEEYLANGPKVSERLSRHGYLLAIFRLCTIFHHAALLLSHHHTPLSTSH